MTTHTESALPSRPRRLGRFAIGLVLLGSAVGFLVYKATGENLTYYRTVDELLASTTPDGEKVRISGDVVEGSIGRNDETRELAFQIESTNPETGDILSMPVLYSGTVPDIFQGGIQVVIEGTVDETGTFQAETLLAKCPSKYQAEGELDSEPPSPQS
jgi:cytochrome c-type biogenesis protein CcmE